MRLFDRLLRLLRRRRTHLIQARASCSRGIIILLISKVHKGYNCGRCTHRSQARASSNRGTQATASTQQPQYYHYIYQQHPQGLQQPQQQHLQYHQPPQPLEPPILERRLPQRPVPRSHGPLEPPQSPSPAELRQRTSKRQRGMSCSAVMPPPPPPRIPQPPPLSVLRHMVIQRRSGTSGSVFGPEPPRPHVPQPPPSCDCCQDLGIVYQERPAERTKTCALCGGVGLVREPSIDAEGVCWHCYGEGETKYTGVDGGWTHCYCKQQRPRPQSSQVAMGSKSL